MKTLILLLSVFSAHSGQAFFLHPWLLCVLGPCNDHTNVQSPHFIDIFNSNKPRKHLSPVNIQVRDAKYLNLPPLIFSSNHWDSRNFFALNNTGELADFRQIPPSKSLTLSGGPLPSIYKFDSLHCHWHPMSDSQGTEHSINQKRFAMEFHAVYYNKIYRSFQNAKGKPDGLAIISFIIESVPGLQNNRDFDFLTEAATKVSKPYTATMIKHNVLLAFKRAALSNKYFHYYGSLTGSSPAPAKWILFKQTIRVSPEQVLPYRKLRNPEGEPIFNIRESQNKHNTIIYSVDSSLPNASKKFWNFLI